VNALRLIRGVDVSDHSSLPAGVAAIDEELVAKLGEIAGLNYPPERLPAITARLRELHTLAAALDSIDQIEAAPAIRFDPTWQESAE
jgi:hypothetical protein